MLNVKEDSFNLACPLYFFVWVRIFVSFSISSFLSLLARSTAPAVEPLPEYKQKSYKTT